MISFSGLATGLDTAAIISQLISVERQPVVRLEQKQTDLNSQSKKLTNIKDLLGKLRDSVQSLDQKSDFSTMAASSSSESTVSVSGTPTGVAGEYKIGVTALAQAERTYSDGFSSSTDTGLFSTGKLRIQVGSDAWEDIDVDSSDTLESIASKINSSDARVSASIIFDGSDYRLQVTGDETGEDNTIDFKENGGLSLGLNVLANQKVTAQDASIDIDGLTVTSSTNKVVGAIPGLTLDLHEISATDTTIEVGFDSSAIESKLATFVDTYNGVINAVNSELNHNGVTKGTNTLFGDSTLRNLQGRLASNVTSAVSGLTGKYDSLASIGVTSNKDGTLSINKSKLADAVSEDADAVESVLVEDVSAGTTGIMAMLDNHIADFARASDGALAIRISGIENQVRDIDDQIDRFTLRIDKREEILQSQFASLESLASGLQTQGSALAAMLNS